VIFLYKKYIPIIIFLLIAITIVFKFEKKEILEIKEIEKIEVSEEEIVIKDIYVDVKGEVKKPGLYVLREGSRVNDAITLAGGLLKTADLKFINLSKALKDEMIIWVHSKEEVKEKIVIEYIYKDCDCQNTIIGEENRLVNINTASLEQIMTLPGIGESKAKTIISYREQNGPFSKLEDITLVSGIGSATYENIKNYITL
jgi:competence protein ComEA